MSLRSWWKKSANGSSVGVSITPSRPTAPVTPFCSPTPMFRNLAAEEAVWADGVAFMSDRVR